MDPSLSLSLSVSLASFLSLSLSLSSSSSAASSSPPLSLYLSMSLSLYLCIFAFLCIYLSLPVYPYIRICVSAYLHNSCISLSVSIDRSIYTQYTHSFPIFHPWWPQFSQHEVPASLRCWKTTSFRSSWMRRFCDSWWAMPTPRCRKTTGKTWEKTWKTLYRIT
jgi:hypothetical protein